MNTEPRSRPILFSAPMVRALLDGTKTQTRRIMKPQPPANACYWKECSAGQWLSRDYGQHWKCPQGVAGDRLWVKETWHTDYHWNGVKPTLLPAPAPSRDVLGSAIHYAATSEDFTGRVLRPSLFMRRWMSRITLEIVSVRVERLNDISEADAVAEGVTLARYMANPFQTGIHNARFTGEVQSARDAYKQLWESINAPGSWDENPFVWVVEFRRVQP